MSLARNPARQLLAQASSSLRAPRSAARVAVAGARLPRATRLVAPMSTSAPRRLADAKGTPAEESAESKESAVGKGLGIKETPDAKGAAAAPAEHEAKLKEKDAKIKELQDQVLYAKADLQNIQRRSSEEKTQASDFAITKFARDLTASLDVLQLALKSVPEALRQAPKELPSEDPRRAVAELYDGVELTSKSIRDMLARHGVTTYDPTGEKFDPVLHEALYQAPVPGKEPGSVLECSKLGFMIKGRVLRAAQVGVVQEA